MIAQIQEFVKQNGGQHPHKAWLAVNIDAAHVLIFL